MNYGNQFFKDATPSTQEISSRTTGAFRSGIAIMDDGTPRRKGRSLGVEMVPPNEVGPQEGIVGIQHEETRPPPLTFMMEEEEESENEEGEQVRAEHDQALAVKDDTRPKGDYLIR